MPDKPLCLPNPKSECRKTCYLYRAIPDTRGQSYKNFDTGDGLRCKDRIDVTQYSVHAVLDWRVVDEKVSTTNYQTKRKS